MVRIPSAVARSARLSVDLSVVVVLEDTGLMAKPVEEPKLTLPQKLAIYDSTKHGGEVMWDRPNW